MNGRVELATVGGARDVRALVAEGRDWIRRNGPGSARARLAELDAEDARLAVLLAESPRSVERLRRELDRQDADLELVDLRYTQRARRTAYHEAGHAAVAWALGVRLGDVWIFHDRDGQTEEHVLGSCHVACGHPVVTAAGVEAESLVGDVSEASRELHDRRVFRVHHTLTGEHLEQDEFVAVWTEAEERVRAMRPAISALAEQLLRRGFVAGEDAEALIANEAGGRRVAA